MNATNAQKKIDQVLEGLPQLETPIDTKNQIREFLYGKKKARRPLEIAKATGLNHNTVRRDLIELSKANHVSKPGTKKYKIAYTVTKANMDQYLSDLKAKLNQ